MPNVHRTPGAGRPIEWVIERRQPAIADAQRAIVRGERPTFHVLAAPLLAGWELTVDELPGIRVPVVKRQAMLPTAYQLIADVLVKPLDSFDVDLEEVRYPRSRQSEG